MKTLTRLVHWMREPWLTRDRAIAELRERWPHSEARIVAGPGFVKVYQGRMLATNRPTLKQAMDRIRKYCPKKIVT